MSEEKFSKCGEEKKCLSVEFRVFEEKELGGKFQRKKIKVFLGRKFKVKIFVVKEKLKLGENIQVVSNFVWALC